MLSYVNCNWKIKITKIKRGSHIKDDYKKLKAKKMHITKLVILSYYFKYKTENPHKCTCEKKS